VKLVRRVLVVLLVAAAFVAAYQFGKNADPLTVSWFRWTSPPAPTWLVLLVVFGLGVLLTTLLFLYQVTRLSLLARRYRKEVASLEAEVHKLRNLPLAADAGSGLAPAARGEARRG
jgi:uncharacterized integral membrane protein